MFLNFCYTGIRELQINLSEVSKLDNADLQLLRLLKAESKKRRFELSLGLYRLIAHSN